MIGFTDFHKLLRVVCHLKNHLRLSLGVGGHCYDISCLVLAGRLDIKYQQYVLRLAFSHFLGGAVNRIFKIGVSGISGSAEGSYDRKTGISGSTLGATGGKTGTSASTGGVSQ